jgi:hypothetical protein
MYKWSTYVLLQKSSGKMVRDRKSSFFASGWLPVVHAN